MAGAVPEAGASQSVAMIASSVAKRTGKVCIGGSGVKRGQCELVMERFLVNNSGDAFILYH